MDISSTRTKRTIDEAELDEYNPRYNILNVYTNNINYMKYKNIFLSVKKFTT